MHRRLPDLLSIALLSAEAGCSAGHPPQIALIEDQVAVVGQELAVWVVATDADGEELTYAFEAPAVPFVSTTAQISTGPGGQGLFTFTPRAEQIGDWLFDLIVSDGAFEDRTSIRVDVRSAAESGSAPIFRKPLASGAVLDLGAEACASVDVLVEDADSAELSLSVDGPDVEGSELRVATGGLSASWQWCPLPAQRVEQPHHSFTFVAEDGESPAVRKDFVVVVRPADPGDCPGTPPTIEHVPTDVSTLADVQLEARVTDIEGISGTPFVLYATEDPGSPPDYGAMSLAAFELELGGARDGTWRTAVPNPVVGDDEGSTRTLYYAISVVDAAGCITDHPPAQVHAVQVTHPGDAGTAACEDDDAEPNDGVGTALAKPRLPEGSHPGLRLCPGNDDWYAFVLGYRARVRAELTGPAGRDLDLALTGEGGVVFEASEGSTSVESISTGCLDPDDYLLRVYSIFADAEEPAHYDLALSLDPEGC